jgi:hypothetical protein
MEHKKRNGTLDFHGLRKGYKLRTCSPSKILFQKVLKCYRQRIR